ncbi:MAG: DUF6391 domain-containing protein [Anaerolineales bacterium]|nr:DUF6391 domain-containing protein [Anaerolineales bacterium]MCS7249263.1 DUF6391 domain-containing protein [Anaerolineales bacterium]MDW8163077.1 DUF6391 domain-containing protein [Anaerolineales bacterium]MDW8445683.1 DUF6391 domain-containing protein [Anaerolineales bacterium]
MSPFLASPMAKISLLQFFERVRRNHALEHATLHVLARRKPHTSMAGQSDFFGFWILGDVTFEEVQTGVAEALQRLRSGERDLAIHPFCGTNLAAAALLGGATALFAFLGSGRRLRDKLERLPLAISLSGLSLLLARPLGTWLQRNWTTSAEVSTLEVRDIRLIQYGRLRAFRVSTQG